MIEYETDSSPFFADNKNYCQEIERKLSTLNTGCSGFCNSFGYHLEANLKRNKLTFNLKFHKHQSTQNGVVIPVDALDYSGTEIKVEGLNKKFSVTVGKSALRRLFTSKNLMAQIPYPFFAKFSHAPGSDLINSMVSSMQDNRISVFKLHNGTLVCKMHAAAPDPLNLIEGIESTIESWT